jgi:hypothetical protein
MARRTSKVCGEEDHESFSEDVIEEGNRAKVPYDSREDSFHGSFSESD